MFSYDTWLDEQHEMIRAELDDIGHRCGYLRSVSLYAVPSQGAIAGKLIASQQPIPGSDVVRFPAQGSAVMAVPRSHLRALLWDACRRLPICPTA